MHVNSFGICSANLGRATDQHSNCTRRFADKCRFSAIITLFCLAFLASPTFLSAQERGVGVTPTTQSQYSRFYDNSYALVIGIDDYTNAPKLKYATADAKSVVNVLETRFGFDPKNITTLFDKKAGRKEIMLAFDHLRRVARKNDRVFVFYAGHGTTEAMPDGRQKGYILPCDADQQDVLTTAISTDQLNEISQVIAAKHLFFVMDACYGGLIFSRATSISPSAADYLEVISTRKARKALTAGGQDQTVLDTGPGGHSVFTYYLVYGLSTGAADLNGDGIITSAELEAYIGPRVTAESNRSQTPEYGILGGDMGGDFVFVPSNAVVPSVSQTTIGSDPDSAEVTIDGKFAGVTPLTTSLALTKHMVTISKKGYDSKSDTLLLALSGPSDFRYTLNPVEVDVHIASNVDSALVYVDTKLFSKISGFKANLKVPIGNHVIEVKKSQFASSSANVNLVQDSVYNLAFSLDRTYSTLDVKVTPDSASIYLDGSLVLFSSGELQVKIGEHDLKVVKQGYEPSQRKVVASAGYESAAIDLVPIIGTVDVTTNPPGASVSVDGQPASSTPASLKIAYGNHMVTITKPGYKTVTFEEDVKTTGSSARDFRLAITTQSVADEIVRIQAGSRSSLRWSNFTLTVLAGVASLYEGGEASSSYGNFANTQDVNMKNRSLDNFHFHALNQNVLLGATGAFALSTLCALLTGVDRDGAYSMAADYDSKGINFYDLGTVDSTFAETSHAMMDFSGGYGFTPVPGNLMIMTVVPIGFALNVPIVDATCFRVGANFYHATSETEEKQKSIRPDDPILYRLSFWGVKVGLGTRLWKVRVAGDYVFLFNPDQSSIHPLLPNTMFEMSVQAETLPGFFMGIGATMFDSNILWSVSYDRYTGRPKYVTSSAGLSICPTAIIGFSF